MGPGESVADKAGWGGLSCAESGVMEQGEGGISEQMKNEDIFHRDLIDF